MPSESWQQAWVEVLPDLSEFKAVADKGIVSTLGRAGDLGARNASTSMGAVFAGSFFGAILADLGVRIVGSLVEGIRSGVEQGIQFALGGINLASDLGETRDAVQRIFGDASGAVEAFAATAVGALGQTEQQALAAAQSFGAFGKAAGLTGDDLSGFTTDLVGLATDLASFGNTDVDTAIQAIGAALRGESEPIRQYQVLLDEATLKQQALALGIYDGNGALTQQQRVLAASAAIFAQTTDKQGNFADTLHGYANQSKIFAAALTSVQTALGEQLLPAATEFVTFANENFVPVLQEMIDQVGPVLSDALRESAPALQELLLALIPLLPPLVELAVSALPGIVELVKILVPLLVDWASTTRSQIDILQALSSFLAGDSTLADFAAVVNGATGALWEFNRWLINVQVGANQFFASFAQGVNRSITDAITAFLGLPARIGAVFAGAATWLVNTGAQIINGLIAGIQASASRLVAAVLGPIAQVIAAVKKQLGIASPSKVFAEIGGFMAEGMFLGFASASARGTLAIPGISIPNVSATHSAVSAGAAAMSLALPAIYVQNPFTGEYLLARVDQRIDKADTGSDSTILGRVIR